MPYKRIYYEEVEQQYRKLMEEFSNAADGENCMEVIRKRYELQADLTPIELCYVRHDMNVNDEFYAAEQEYYDEIGPKLTDLSNQFDALILQSPWREYLENIIGHQAFTMMESGQKGYSDELIELLQEENALLNRHNQITSRAVADWNGKKVKRSLMGPKLQSKDRGIRKKASLACSASWQEQKDELDDIFQKLVKNRDMQAKKLPFSSYVELSYYRMNRIGYDANDVKVFREQVKKYLVPFGEQLEDKRRQRLGLDHLYIYDGGISFLEGNPVPIHDTKGCLEASRKMYQEMSPETGEFIDFLLDNGLYDVEIRDGKRGGGYMTTFEKYRSPFIMANFDGTTENAYIMCHEGGHAFQGYLKREEEIREQCWLTSEAAETHAMAMEFFAWPYMELFFGKRAEDYRMMHLENAIQLVIYECEQDEFQQKIYENPKLSPKERNELWLELEKEYFPSKDYGEDSNLLEGRRWQRIPHIYQWPFYAIDYALAQICALEYLRWMKKDAKAAWKSYLTFCKETGNKNFPQLIKAAGLTNPFEAGTVRELVNWLETNISQ